jgi:hypothetical protein
MSKVIYGTRFFVVNQLKEELPSLACPKIYCLCYMKLPAYLSTVALYYART